MFEDNKFFTWLESRTWMPKILRESRRSRHLLLSIPAGFIGTILFVLGLAFGMEYKDEIFRKSWDWIDFWFTVLGGMIGQGLQILLLVLILI